MTISTTRFCSACESVGDSPVVPQGTRPSVPFAMWNSTSSRSLPSSTLPSWNGVTIATSEPWKVRRIVKPPSRQYSRGAESSRGR
jgi:hypothetical protein